MINSRTNIQAYQGSLLEAYNRPSDVFLEATVKKPGSLGMKIKARPNKFQDSLAVKSFNLQNHAENCSTPDLIKDTLDNYKDPMYQSLSINQTDYFTFNKGKKR